jgi:hypothetical protein
MINVVGAGQDPETATPATIYSFTPNQKKPVATKTVEPKVPTQKPPSLSDELKSKLQPLASLFVQKPQIPVIVPIDQPKNGPDATISAPKEPELPSSKPNNPKKTSKVWWLVAVLVILGLGIGATLYLTQSNQDIRQQASSNLPAGENLQTQTISPTDEPTPVEEINQPTTTPTIVAGGLTGLVDNQPSLASSESSTIDPELLALNSVPTLIPTSTPTAEPTAELINTKPHCNESCITDENCLNPAHSCYQGACRLTSNVTSSTCLLASGGNQLAVDQTNQDRVYSPNASPSGSAPTAGPSNWLYYGLSGFGLLVFGGLALLWL